MLADLHPIGFIGIADKALARDFYCGVLELELEADTPFAVVVRAGPISVRLTPVPNFSPSAHTVFGWAVNDIVKAAAGLAGRGIRFERYEGLDQSADGIWTSPGGARVAWFKDPFGNVLSLTQV